MCARDFNKAIGDAADGMTRIVEKLGLINCLHEKLGRDDCTTRARGRKRVDFVIGNLDIDCIKDATVHAFGDQEGDHWGFNLDLCVPKQHLAQWMCH